MTAPAPASTDTGGPASAGAVDGAADRDRRSAAAPPFAPLGTLVVRRWDDAVVDSHPMSMPARSDAAETYWLPIIGPTSLLCARRLVSWLDKETSIVVGLDVLAGMLGLGVQTGRGRSAPLPRSLNRLCAFGLAQWVAAGDALDLRVRRTWAPLTQVQIRRLPEALALAYRAEPVFV